MSMQPQNFSNQLNDTPSLQEQQGVHKVSNIDIDTIPRLSYLLDASLPIPTTPESISVEDIIGQTLLTGDGAHAKRIVQAWRATQEFGDEEVVREATDSFHQCVMGMFSDAFMNAIFEELVAKTYTDTTPTSQDLYIAFNKRIEELYKVFESGDQETIHDHLMQTRIYKTDYQAFHEFIAAQYTLKGIATAGRESVTAPALKAIRNSLYSLSRDDSCTQDEMLAASIITDCIAGKLPLVNTDRIQHLLTQQLTTLHKSQNPGIDWDSIEVGSGDADPNGDRNDAHREIEITTGRTHSNYKPSTVTESEKIMSVLHNKHETLLNHLEEAGIGRKSLFTPSISTVTLGHATFDIIGIQNVTPYGNPRYIFVQQTNTQQNHNCYCIPAVADISDMLEFIDQGDGGVPQRIASLGGTTKKLTSASSYKSMIETLSQPSSTISHLKYASKDLMKHLVSGTPRTIHAFDYQSIQESRNAKVLEKVATGSESFLPQSIEDMKHLTTLFHPDHIKAYGVQSLKEFSEQQDSFIKISVSPNSINRQHQGIYAAHPLDNETRDTITEFCKTIDSRILDLGEEYNTLESDKKHGHTYITYADKCIRERNKTVQPGGVGFLITSPTLLLHYLGVISR